MDELRPATGYFIIWILTLASVGVVIAQEQVSKAAPQTFVRVLDSKTFERWCYAKAIFGTVDIPEGIVVKDDSLIAVDINVKLSEFYVAKKLFGAFYVPASHDNDWKASYFVPSDVYHKFASDTVPGVAKP